MWRASLFALLSALVAVAVLGDGAARGSEPPIVLRIPDCPAAPLSLDAFLGSLKAELAGRTPPCCALDAGDAPAGMRVTLSIEPCGPGADQVAIAVRGAGGQMGERRIALGDILPGARPRALALAVAELVRAVAEAPAPSSAPALAAIPARAQNPPAARALVASGLLEARLYPGHRLTLWGLRADLQTIRRDWQAAFGLDLVAGDPEVPLGDVRTGMIGAVFEVGRRVQTSHLALDIGPTASVAWMHLAGHATAPDSAAGTGSALVASIGGRLAVDVPGGPSGTRLRGLAEAGGVLEGAEAAVNGSPAAGARGFYLLLALGVGSGARR